MTERRPFDPIWRTHVVERESVRFIGQPGGDGEATLLFEAVADVRVTDGREEIVFVEGRDYVDDAASGVVRRLPGSRLAATAPSHLADAGGDLRHHLQALVSYSHAGTWTGFTPRFAGPSLPRTVARLRAGVPLTIAISGDSISEGYDASGFHGIPPHRPPYAALLPQLLQDSFASPITLHNLAVAGWTADDGLADVERVVAVKPDLVVVAYGMNDAGYAEPDSFGRTIAAIVDAIRVGAPDAEYILVSPMLPTPEFDYAPAARFPLYRDALVTLCGAGIALADVTSLWSDMLRRKHPHDLSGNGWNHPNDFGHRVYADVLAALLVDDADTRLL